MPKMERERERVRNKEKKWEAWGFDQRRESDRDLKAAVVLSS